MLAFFAMGEEGVTRDEILATEVRVLQAMRTGTAQGTVWDKGMLLLCPRSEALGPAKRGRWRRCTMKTTLVNGFLLLSLLAASGAGTMACRGERETQVRPSTTHESRTAGDPEAAAVLDRILAEISIPDDCAEMWREGLPTIPENDPTLLRWRDPEWVKGHIASRYDKSDRRAWEQSAKECRLRTQALRGERDGPVHDVAAELERLLREIPIPAACAEEYREWLRAAPESDPLKQRWKEPGVLRVSLWGIHEEAREQGSERVAANCQAFFEMLRRSRATQTGGGPGN
jgi:hypothetical protein